MTAEKTFLTCNGIHLKHLAAAGLSWLESHYRRVNELNVFPVPDGDTGTNMLLTMRNAYKEIAELDSVNVGKVASKIGHGAMMGSRGNSGTIMSQLWIGLARAIGDAENIDAPLLATALRTATDTAYRGVQRPVEGTILTVAREMTEEVESLVETVSDLQELLEAMIKRGWDAVDRTPEMLPVLKDAGVVDSGGTGLMYILEGMLRYLKGEEVTLEGSIEDAFETELEDMHHEGELQHPGENFYDVQFVIKGSALNGEVIKSAVESMGESAVVVAMDEAVKVHVHVHNPGLPLEYAANVGHLTDVVVENMLEQYEEYRLKFQSSNHDNWVEKLGLIQVDPGQIGIVTVASGEGIGQIFQQLGVAGIVMGGQTNNPSVEELLACIQSVNTEKIILLPNNKNIILAAEQAAKLSKEQRVIVVPTRSFPQGISAMLPYQPDGDLDEVAQSMLESMDAVITGEVTIATRTVELDSVKVEDGQVIGLLNGALKVAGDSIDSIVCELLGLANLDDMELITLYYGSDVQEEQAQQLADRLADMYPDLEFEIVMGGQPHYHYVLGVE
jgi:hypothetical protein